MARLRSARRELRTPRKKSESQRALAEVSQRERDQELQSGFPPETVRNCTGDKITISQGLSSESFSHSKTEFIEFYQCPLIVGRKGVHSGRSSQSSALHPARPKNHVLHPRQSHGSSKRAESQSDLDRSHSTTTQHQIDHHNNLQDWDPTHLITIVQFFPYCAINKTQTLTKTVSISVQKVPRSTYLQIILKRSLVCWISHH